jgi:hypothetical protein
MNSELCRRSIGSSLSSQLLPGGVTSPGFEELLLLLLLPLLLVLPNMVFSIFQPLLSCGCETL